MLSTLIPFLMRYWMQALLVVAVPSMLYMAYDRIQESAIKENNQAWESKLTEMESRLSTKVDEVKTSSQEAARKVSASIKKQSSEIDSKLKSFKVTNAPGDFMVINTESGKCEFRKEYTDAFISIRNTLK